MATITTAEAVRADDEPAKSSWKRRADIQGLRGLAVLLVVIYHADRQLQGGYIGVDIFFVLSGFVITGMILDRLNSPSGFPIARFYLNRIVRLLPALALVLSVVAIATPFAISPLGPQEATVSTGRAASLFHANTELTSAQGYFSLSAETNPLLHMWSLSVEEQFYVVFPLAFVGLWSFGRRMFPGHRRWMPLALAAVAVPSFYLSQQTVSGGLAGVLDAPQAFAFYSSFTRAWEFLAGAVLVFVLRLRNEDGASRPFLGLAGLAVVLLGSVTLSDSTVFPGAAALVPVVGTCLIIAGGDSKRSLVGQLLSSRPLVWLGDRSYSWYLWHWPAIVVARSLWPEVARVGAIAAALSIIPAGLAFSYFEDPIRRTVRWASPGRVVGLAAVCILVPIALFSLVGPIFEATRSVDTQALVESQAIHADLVQGCDSDASVADKGPSCVWPAADGSDRTVVLVGDSNAGHFVEPLAAASNAAGYDFVAATRSGCLFSDLVLIRNDQVEEGCREFVAGSIDDLVAEPPDIVFIASSDIYLFDQNVELVHPVSMEQAATPASKADLFSTQLRSTLERLVDAGIRVYVVETIPHLSWNPVHCGAQAIQDPRGCNVESPRGDVLDRHRAVAGDAIRAAIGDRRGVSSIDLIDDICSVDVCSAFANGVWVYRDGGHLSVEGSLLLTPRFEALIRDN